MRPKNWTPSQRFRYWRLCFEARFGRGLLARDLSAAARKLPVLGPADLSAVLEDQAGRAALRAFEGRMADAGLRPTAPGAGAVGSADAAAVFLLARRACLGRDSARMLEIGTHLGHSTLYLAGAAAETGARVTTVDIADVNGPNGAWAAIGAMPPAVRLDSVGLRGRVSFETRTSESAWREEGLPYDFIFIDGEHSEVAVLIDLLGALGRAAPGSTVLLHDFNDPGDPIPGIGPTFGTFWAMRRLARRVPGATLLPLRSLPFGPRGETVATSLAILVAAS